MKVYQLQKSADSLRRSVESLRSQLKSLDAELKKAPNVSDAARAALKSLTDKVDDLQRKTVASADQSGGAGPALPDAPRTVVGRLAHLSGPLASYPAPPPPSQSESIGELTSWLTSLVD